MAIKVEEPAMLRQTRGFVGALSHTIIRLPFCSNEVPEVRASTLHEGPAFLWESLGGVRHGQRTV